MKELIDWECDQGSTPNNFGESRDYIDPRRRGKCTRMECYDSPR